MTRIDLIADRPAAKMLPTTFMASVDTVFDQMYVIGRGGPLVAGLSRRFGPPVAQRPRTAMDESVNGNGGPAQRKMDA